MFEVDVENVTEEKEKGRREGDQLRFGVLIHRGHSIIILYKDW